MSTEARTSNGGGVGAPVSRMGGPIPFLPRGMGSYFATLRDLVLRPSRFYGEQFLDPDPGRATRFVLRTGLYLAIGLSVAEALASRSWSWTIMAFTGLMLLVLPLLMLVAAAVWTRFLRLGSVLLVESVPLPEARIAVAYSTAGLLPLMFGGIAAWLAFVTLAFQIVGIERGLSCSRVKAAVLVLFPFGIASLLFLFFQFMFEVF